MKNFLQKYLAYLVCALGVLGALVAWIQGSLTGGQFVEAIVVALSGIAAAVHVSGAATVAVKKAAMLRSHLKS